MFVSRSVLKKKFVLIFRKKEHNITESNNLAPPPPPQKSNGASLTVANLKGLVQAKIIKKSVILFRVLNMTI